MEEGVFVSRCPFLSTEKNNISCFEECALYDWQETEGMCPFKSMYDFRYSEKESSSDDYYNTEDKISEKKVNYI